MKKRVVRSFMYAMVAASFMFFIHACTKDDIEQEDFLNALATETVQGLEIRSKSFSHGCFELVFPVSLLMPDGIIKIVESNDTLRKLLKGYCMANNDRPKPELIFPIEIKAQDGMLMKVLSKEDLKNLKQECFKNYLDSLRHRDKNDRKNDTLCFSLVYPIEIKKPDGTLAKITSKEELKALIKNEARISYRKKSKLEIVFPIEVKLSDGSSKLLNSNDELRSLKRSCNDD